MAGDLPDTALELRSLVTSGGALKPSLHEVAVPVPGANEVLVRVEASPINPSDLGLLIGSADMTTATVGGTPERPVVTASVGEAALKGQSARIDKSLPVGNEGAGTVVAAGSSAAAQALVGKTLAIAGGAMYSQYRAIDASACLVLHAGTTAGDGASSFVNPMTALGMTETMRREGHSALVHTAAASNLGQMLVELCQKDGRVSQRWRSKTFFCNRLKKLSMAALSPAAPTRPMEPSMSWRPSAWTNFRLRN